MTSRLPAIGQTKAMPVGRLLARGQLGSDTAAYTHIGSPGAPTRTDRGRSLLSTIVDGDEQVRDESGDRRRVRRDATVLAVGRGSSPTRAQLRRRYDHIVTLDGILSFSGKEQYAG